MQAGITAFWYGSAGRHLRYVALTAALVIIQISLWVRLVASNTTSNANISVADTGIALLAGTAALIAMVMLWRRPLHTRSRAMATPALRQQLATHHAGHIVAAHLDNPNRVERANLSEPCGLHSSQTPVVTQSALHSEIVIALSGMAAEEIFSGESGAHVDQDLGRVTSIAANMVGRYGMAGSLVSLGTKGGSGFVKGVLEDPRTRKELESTLRESKREAVRIMLDNRHTIIAIRDALMRRGRLNGTEIQSIINNADKLRRNDDQVLVDLRIVGDRTTQPASSTVS